MIDGWRAHTGNRMSIQSIRNRPGHYRIRLNLRTSKGRKEIDRVVQAANRRAAQEIEDDLRNEARGERRDRMTVKAYVDSWFRRRVAGEGDQGQLRRGTLLRYSQHLDRFVAALGHVYMDELTPMMIREWLAAEAETEGRGPDGKLSGYTLLGMLRVVRTVTRDATCDLRLPHWSCERVKCPKPLQEAEDDENALSPEELGRLLDAMRVQMPLYFPMFALMAFTGLRYCHAHALEWADLDLEARTYRLTRSRYKGESATPSRKKSGRHSGAIVPEVVAVLVEHRAWLRSRGYDGPLAFPSAAETHIDHRSFSRVLKRVAESVGIMRRFTPHGCRRTLNTIAMSFAPAELVRKVIGHSTAGMTEKYLATGMDAKRALVEAVALLVRPQGGGVNGGDDAGLN